MVTACLKSYVLMKTPTEVVISGITSIDGKSLIIEKTPLEGVLHLGSVNDVIFGLQ